MAFYTPFVRGGRTTSATSRRLAILTPGGWARRPDMSNHPIVPCLWFDEQAEHAASCYTQTFPDGRVTAVLHHPESMDNPSGKGRHVTAPWR